MSTPPITKSGEVYDVEIDEGVAPTTLAVGIGDEIRWVNHRSSDVVSISLMGRWMRFHANEVSPTGWECRKSRQQWGPTKPRVSVSRKGKWSPITFEWILRCRVETDRSRRGPGGQLERRSGQLLGAPKKLLWHVRTSTCDTPQEVRL